MTENAIQTEGKAVAIAIADHIERRTEICLSPTHLEPVNDILRVHVRCDAQTFHDGRTRRETGPNEPFSDQLINWLNAQADDLRPFIRNNKIFLEQRLAWVPAASGAILELAIDGAALLANEIAELADEVSKLVNDITSTPEFQASLEFGGAFTQALLGFAEEFLGKTKRTVEETAAKSTAGIGKARQFLNQVKADLKQLFKEIKILIPQAKQAGERIWTRMEKIEVPQNLKGDDYGISRASAYLSEVDEIAREELKKLPLGTKTLRYIEKFERAFRWISIAASINAVVQSDRPVRQALMEIAAFTVGFGISTIFAIVLLPTGPVLFPPLFIVSSGVASYYGTEAAKDIVGALYDWAVEGKAPAVFAD